MLVKLTSESEQIIKDHSLEIFPIESCGIIISAESGQRVMKSKNIFNSEKKFLIDNLIFSEVKENEKIIGIYHSHTHDGFEDFSPEDIAMSEKIKIPFVLYNVISDEFKHYTPTNKKLPLIGRPFFPPIFTCISLVKEYYKEILGLDLNINEEIEAIKLFYNLICTPSISAYKALKKIENHPKKQFLLEVFLVDFVQVKEYKMHDIFLMKLKDIVPDYYTNCGVFDTEDTFIVAYLPAESGRLSTREPVSKIADYQSINMIYLRHKSLL